MIGTKSSGGSRYMTSTPTSYIWRRSAATLRSARSTRKSSPRRRPNVRGRARWRMEGLRMGTRSFEMMDVFSPVRLTTRIKRIELFRVRVPLKKEIKHASHSRTESENLVVRVELANGQSGYGESVPRNYVTGETLESTFATLGRHDWARMMGQPRDFAAAVGCLEALTVPEIK